MNIATNNAINAGSKKVPRLRWCDDGIWYRYSQWPSAEARTLTFDGLPVDAAALREMRDAIVKR